MAGAAGHPEQDHTFAAAHGLSGPSGFSTHSHELWKRESGHAGQRGLEHAPAVLHHQALSDTGIQPGEGVVVAVNMILHEP